MTMANAFAFYGGAGAGLEDVVVKNFVDYGYTSALVLGYGSIPAARHVRFEDVHFVSTQKQVRRVDSIHSGVLYRPGVSPPKPAANKRWTISTLSTVRGNMNGGQIYIDGGDSPLTNFVFENCSFATPSRPAKITGSNVGPILFKNVKVNGTLVTSIDQLRRAGWDISVPMKFEVTSQPAAGGRAPQPAKK